MLKEERRDRDRQANDGEGAVGESAADKKQRYLAKAKAGIERIKLVDENLFIKSLSSRHDLMKGYHDTIEVLEQGYQDWVEIERILGFTANEVEKAFQYPTEALDLVDEWDYCRTLQRREFIKEKGVHDPSLELTNRVTTEPPKTSEDVLPRFTNDAERTFQNKGSVRLAPAYREDIVKYWLRDHRPERVTFFKGTTLRAIVRNPLPYILEGCICDMCNAAGVRVCFQVANDDGTRDASNYCGGEGLDACLACTVHYLQQTALDFKTFLRHPAPEVLCGATNPPFALTRSYADHCRCNINNVEIIEEGSQLLVNVGIAPRGAHIVAWTRLAGADASSPLAKTEDGEPNQNTEWDLVQSTIPSDWQSAAEVDFLGAHRPEQTNSSEDIGMTRAMSTILGSCSVCLDELHIGEGDCIQTRCNHWFHLKCLHHVQRSQRTEKDDKFLCPLCRTEDPIATDENPDEVAQSSVYTVTMKLPQAQQGVSSATVYIGVIVSADGKCTNATDIGACVKFEVPLK